MTYRSLLLVVSLGSYATGFSQKGEYAFSSSQREAVQKLLADSTQATLVLKSACTNSYLSEYVKEHAGYTPYFCTGDFDGDGMTDFVIATQTQQRFDLFLYRSTKTGYRKPHWFASLDWLNECGLFAQKGKLRVGKFFSDDVISFVWNRTTQKFEQESSSTEE